MQSTNVYLGLLRERGKQAFPLQRVYRQLFNRNLYLSAYGKIYRNAGSTTKGVTDETVDAMSLEKIDAIIEALRHERYQWQPAKRISIPKRNGKKRALGLPVWSDKLLAEVIRMVLNAYYDVQFSNHSHGFREGRGGHWSEPILPDRGKVNFPALKCRWPQTQQEACILNSNVIAFYYTLVR